MQFAGLSSSVNEIAQVCTWVAGSNPLHKTVKQSTIFSWIREETDANLSTCGFRPLQLQLDLVHTWLVLEVFIDCLQFKTLIISSILLNKFIISALRLNDSLFWASYLKQTKLNRAEYRLIICSLRRELIGYELCSPASEGVRVQTPGFPPSGRWPAPTTATRPEACWCSTWPTEPPSSTSESGTARCAITCALTGFSSSWWATRATKMKEGWWAERRPRFWPGSWGCPTWRCPPRRARTWATPSSSLPGASTRVYWAEKWSCRKGGMESSPWHHRVQGWTERARGAPPLRQRASAAVKTGEVATLAAAMEP